VFIKQRYLKRLFQTVDHSQPLTRPALTERERASWPLAGGHGEHEIGDQLRASEAP